MPGVFKRILGISRATKNAYQEKLKRYLTFEETVFHTTDTGFSHVEQSAGAGRLQTDAGPPRQVKEDLALFGLSHPSTLEAVRKARNREVKKYHPDRHLKDPEKNATAKEIMQMLNAAYERIETYYETHPS